MREKNGGFTLVELLITIVCASLISAAAVSLALLGLRMEAKAEDTVGRQQTARIVLKLMEDMAGSGQIQSVETVGEDWALLDGSGAVLLQYGNGALATGGGSVLMDGLKGAEAELKGDLLTFTVETGDGKYTSSVYCRTNVASGEFLVSETETAINSKADAGLAAIKGDPSSTYNARYEFLKVLSAQYGSTGQIKGGTDAGKYYSQWYCDPTNWQYLPGWNENTPWCACFLSWALDTCGSVNGTAPHFAEVNAWMNAFGTDAWHGNGTYTPIPGDLIFFDWELDGSANHVGAVLYVDRDVDGDVRTVYTIEGNSGSGAVLLHRYSPSDRRILGYGVLDWKVTATEESSGG